MSRRGAVGVAVLLFWAAGLAIFARRELFRAPAQRLAEAALRVAPGAAYYAVERDGRHLGFASSTIDTVPSAIRVTDYLVADVPVGGKHHRATAESIVELTRSLALTNFSVSFESDSAPISIAGRTVGDSVLEFAVSHAGETADTQRVVLTGPILLPTLVPLAVALGEQPRVGRSYTLSTFDPTALGTRAVTVRVEAESVFVVGDSAAFDESTRRWRLAHSDTVRAWRLEWENGNGIQGWVDEQGRIVELTHAVGFVLRRTAYELAFENWRLDNPVRSVGRAKRDDIFESTAIAASAPIDRRRLERLRVRLRGVDLGGFALQGFRQRLSSDTLVVERAPPRSLRARYALPADSTRQPWMAPYLRAEPLVQSDHPEIVAVAARLRGSSTDPAAVARRIHEWVHDSLAKAITVSVPSALQVLRARSGDCNEHTQLAIALARAAGIPARAAAGLSYVNNRFYFHAWPEFLLDGWVAVDPTFGQFPADAAHLRFVYGGIAEQAKLLQLIGKLEIEVLGTK